MTTTQNNQTPNAYTPSVTPRVVPGATTANVQQSAYALNSATSLKALAVKAAASVVAKK